MLLDNSDKSDKICKLELLSLSMISAPTKSFNAMRCIFENKTSKIKTNLVIIVSGLPGNLGNITKMF